MTTHGSNGVPPQDPDADRLGAAWNAIVTGGKPDIDERDADLLGVVRSLHRGAPVASASDTFKTDLKEKIMTSAMTVTVPRPPQPRPLRGFALPRRAAAPALASPRPVARWLPALVSAALLLITIGIAGYATLDRDSSPGPGGPAIQAPATPSPSAEDEDVLLEVPLPADAVPDDGFGEVGMRFFVMAPNSTAAWTCETCELHPGMWAQHVVAGSMTVTSDAALEVIRGDGSQESVPAGTEIEVEAGDTTLIRDGTALEWTNAGSAEVQIISLGVVPGYAQTAPESNQWAETGYDVEYTAAVPAGDWVVRLEAHDLVPGGEIPAPASPSLQFGVAGPETDAYLAGGGEGELTLRSAETTTTVYVMTLEQVGEGAATPTGT